MSTKTSQRQWYFLNGQASDSGQDAVNGLPPEPSSVLNWLPSDTFTGSENPHWRRQVASFSNATTSASGTRWSLTGKNGHLHRYGHLTGSTNVDFYRRCRLNVYTNVPTLSLDASLVQKAENAAATAINKRVDQIVNLFQGGTFLGELSEAIRMIRNPASALRGGITNYLRDLKKRRPKAKDDRSRNRMVQDTWLEYQFGWRPLLSDLDDASSFVSRRQAQLSNVIQLAFATGEERKAEEGLFSTATVAVPLDARFLRRHYVGVRYKVAVNCRNNVPSLLDSAGLGFRDFVPTLWNLLPWSFAIDYFSNVGDVLSSLSNRNIDLAWGWMTRREEISHTLHSQHVRPMVAKVIEMSFEPSSMTFSKVSFVRTSVSSVPIPRVSFEIPGAGSLKWLNLAALARRPTLRSL